MHIKTEIISNNISNLADRSEEWLKGSFPNS